MEGSTAEVVIHPPDSNGLDKFDLEAFMGQWFVTHSTLPLWKSKKDVTITYAPIESSDVSQSSKINDIVEFRSQKSSSAAKRTRIEGVDTLDATADGASTPTARFKWRGKGLLMISTSKWQVLGYGKEEGWAVTFFEKTLFTPAGLDVYSRNEKGLSEVTLKEIFEKTKAVGGQVGQLADSFFEVPRSLAGETSS